MFAPFDERINELRNKWFLMEPAYFMILCTHKLEKDPMLKCDIAVGGGVIHINETYFEDKNDKFLEERLKMEMIRILLKHPYQRMLPNKVKMYMSSNFVIANNTNFGELQLKTTMEAFATSSLDTASLEEIYDAIYLKSNEDEGDGKGDKNKKKQKPCTGSGPGSGKREMSEKDLDNHDDGLTSYDDGIEKTQFWQEDEYRQVEVNSIISKIDKTNSWGNMPAGAVDAIKKSMEPKFNYKAIFQQFRSTILASTRTITRMKPNRRFGYVAPGSKRNFTTRILVAVDTSGSISNEDLELAFGFINKFFKYGIEEISYICFDTKIYPESLNRLTKKTDDFKISGRGGTDFNEVFQYAQETNPIYDGVIILTDGYASVPDSKWLKTNYRGVKYIWCLNDENNFNSFLRHSDFMKFGKATFVDKKYNE